VRSLVFGPVPWLVPGVLVWVLIGLVAARRLGHALNVRGLVAFAMIVSFGFIVSTTLTPLRGALELGASGAGSCDVSRIAPLPPLLWLRLSEPTLNIAMFIPLGLTVALVPRSRIKMVLVVAALAMPFAIELIQLNATILARGCESADVIDNLSGLLVGLGIGTLLVWLGPDRPTGDSTSGGADPGGYGE